MPAPTGTPGNFYFGIGAGGDERTRRGHYSTILISGRNLKYRRFITSGHIITRETGRDNIYINIYPHNGPLSKFVFWRLDGGLYVEDKLGQELDYS